jgi:DNA (cytosine-5)-methyltransferase 1
MQKSQYAMASGIPAQSMKVGSLFSGIGGLDLGLERAGMRVVWQSEIDPYACQVLAKHWPEVPNHGDIKRIDWGTVEPVDVICGGYPCQPFSLAGQRKGTDDPRHLWPWVRDAISALRPRYAILENVCGHLSMGGTVVIGELTEIGYDAEWRVVSAAGLGAPHRRERLFIVAYPKGKYVEESEVVDSSVWRSSRKFGRSWASQIPRLAWSGNEPRMDRVADGLSDWVDRSRGLGNAVVPQVAEYVGRLVMEHAND